MFKKKPIGCFKNHSKQVATNKVQKSKHKIHQRGRQNFGKSRDQVYSECQIKLLKNKITQRMKMDITVTKTVFKLADKLTKTKPRIY